MKLLNIRHGDPDYSIDSLTNVGWKEAELLAQRLKNLDVKAFYVSPLGRARDTAEVTLKLMGREAEMHPWLREVTAARKDGSNHYFLLWDWLPAEWTQDPKLFDLETWTSSEMFREVDVEKERKRITDGLDALLAKHGYVRDGKTYRVEQANEDTIVLFCHFGVECVMLGHMLHISPMVLWHGTCAAPTSVTTVVTEERRPGIASFRMTSFGDTGHLYVANQEPSFAGRFCESYDNHSQRHD